MYLIIYSKLIRVCNVEGAMLTVRNFERFS